MTEEVRLFQILKPWLIETAERAAARAGVTVENATRTLCHGYTGSKHHLRVWSWCAEEEWKGWSAVEKTAFTGEEGGERWKSEERT
jgi:hypothetical protein